MTYRFLVRLIGQILEKLLDKYSSSQTSLKEEITNPNGLKFLITASAHLETVVQEDVKPMPVGPGAGLEGKRMKKKNLITELGFNALLCFLSSCFVCNNGLSCFSHRGGENKVNYPLLRYIKSLFLKCVKQGLTYRIERQWRGRESNIPYIFIHIYLCVHRHIVQVWPSIHCSGVIHCSV